MRTVDSALEEMKEYGLLIDLFASNYKPGVRPNEETIKYIQETLNDLGDILVGFSEEGTIPGKISKKYEELSGKIFKHTGILEGISLPKKTLFSRILTSQIKYNPLKLLRSNGKEE
jgi:hypothetical protein